MENKLLRIAVVLLSVQFFAQLFEPAASAVELIGITINNELVSLDPYTGEITDTHVQLNPYPGVFCGLTYNRNENILYALSNDDNIYTIDPITLEIGHFGNLRIDKGWFYYRDEINSLAYDPNNDTLYTAMNHYSSYDSGLKHVWSQAAEIDLATMELNYNVSDEMGSSIGSLSFDEERGMLRAISFHQSAWEEPPESNSHIVEFYPHSIELTQLFEFPYRSVSGLAKEPGTDVFYSRVSFPNTGEGFYARSDLSDQSFTKLAETDYPSNIYAMLYKDFYIQSKPIWPIEEIPRKFIYKGRIAAIYDPKNMLNGEVAVGDAFSGHFHYDANSPYKKENSNAEAPYGVAFKSGNLSIDLAGLYCGVQNNYFSIYYGDTVRDAFLLYTDTEKYNRYIEFELIDKSAKAISNNNKLPEKFELSDWGENRFRVYGCTAFGSHNDIGPCFSIHASISSVEPVEIEEPTEPEPEPTEPEPEPTEPEPEPVEPEPEPTEPEPEPTEPEPEPVEPVNPNPVYPVNPVNPVNPGRKSDPTQPVQPTQPVEPTQPTQPTPQNSGNSNGGSGGCFISSSLR